MATEATDVAGLWPANMDSQTTLASEPPPTCLALLRNHLLHTWHWTAPLCSHTGLLLSLIHLCLFLSLSCRKALPHNSQTTCTSQAVTSVEVEACACAVSSYTCFSSMPAALWPPHTTRPHLTQHPSNPCSPPLPWAAPLGRG